MKSTIKFLFWVADEVMLLTCVGTLAAMIFGTMKFLLNP